MNQNKTYYKSFENFLIRTPLLSLNYIQSVFSDKDTSVETIQEICKNEIINEAIFLASPAFYEQLTKWLNNELTDQKEIDNLCYSVTKYLLRMGSRCTPFGLFAGYNLGKTGNQTNIELNDLKNYYGHLRLDMNYLCALAMDLAKIPEIKSQIKFYPNSSIYNSGDNLRYVEYQYINSRRNHFIVGVENSEYLQQVLKAAEKGASINELANLLADEEISYQEAENFIEELIESQLLISELEPSVTGPEFLDQIINILSQHKEIGHILKYLHKIKSDIQNISNQPVGIPVKNYIDITTKLSNLNTKYDLKYLFQTDMVVSCKVNELKESIVNDVIKGIEIMNRLTPVWTNGNLSKFKETFYERYEEREMPLSKVLDVESGIGYVQSGGSGDVSPLVDDIVLPAGSGQNETNIKWNSIQSFLLKKYTEATSKGLNEIEIFDKEIQDFHINWDDLPPTISTMAEIIEASSENGRDPLIYLNSAGGSSAANLLGRFCHSDDSLLKYVKNITKKEQQISQAKIFAEIVHLPE
ncbi:MAG: lantibiotic dehydratase family protein, partial [Bacteroidales bacterium]|nr:lantibiotic dehydratase family protein [Bacteroidales bacterium]